MMKQYAIGLAALLFGITAAAAADGWKVKGSKGLFYIVEIERSQATNQDIYRIAVAELCSIKPICIVLFWVKGGKTPTKLPITDAQVRTQAAQWNRNENTGLRRLLWSCTLFPETPKDECL
jgi:hypothetical protein